VLIVAAATGLALLKHRADLRARAAEAEQERQEGENRVEFGALIDRSMALVVPRAGEGSLPYGTISYPWMEGCHTEINQVRETLLLSNCGMTSLYKESHARQFELRDVDQYVRSGAFRQLASVVLNMSGSDTALPYTSRKQDINIFIYSRDVWVIDIRHNAVTAHRTFTSDSPPYTIPDVDAFERHRRDALEGLIRSWLGTLAVAQ
jgi:hypothetical protein